MSSANLVLDTKSSSIPLYDPENLIIDTDSNKISISGQVNHNSKMALFDELGQSIDVWAQPAGPWSREIDPKDFFMLSACDGGARWKAGVSLKVGDVVRPASFSGFVYRVTSSGVSGVDEPLWWYPSIRLSGYIGTAEAEVHEYRDPVCHGLIEAKLRAAY